MSSYPSPDELDKIVDELHLSPEMEHWCISAIMEYRMVATTLMNLHKKDKAHHVE